MWLQVKLRREKINKNSFKKTEKKKEERRRIHT
jgi:hypothetical protein